MNKFKDENILTIIKIYQHDPSFKQQKANQEWNKLRPFFKLSHF